MKKTSSQHPFMVTNRDDPAELEREINELRQKLEWLQEAPRKLKTEEPPPPARRLPLWMLVRDHLRDNGSEDTLQNIIDAMLSAGHDLGKFPYRNVKNTVVSRYMAGMFSYRKEPNGTEMVKLVGNRLPYSPARRQS